jgi:hypothetical protein
MTRPRPCFNCGEETHYEDETPKWSTSLCDDHYFCHADCVKEYGARLERERNIVTFRKVAHRLALSELHYESLVEDYINAVAAGAGAITVALGESVKDRPENGNPHDGSIPSDGIKKRLCGPAGEKDWKNRRRLADCASASEVHDEKKKKGGRSHP